MNRIRITCLIGIFVISALSFPYVFAESGDIQVEIKYTNGDRADFNGLKLVIYQDNDKMPILQKMMERNPEVISLPVNHRYKVEVFGNGMYADVGYVELKDSFEKLVIHTPLTGGLKFIIFYDDGQKPIQDARIIIKSYDGEEWRSGKTNTNGETLRYWIQPTIRQTDYYILEIYLGDLLVHTESQIKLQEGIAQDRKITTSIPKIVDDLITVSLYNSTSQKISNKDGVFSVILENSEGSFLKKSMVNFRGDAYFSNIPSGQYTMSVLKDGEVNSDWDSMEIAIIGTNNNFEIYRKNIENVKNFDDMIEEKAQSCNCIAFRFDDVQDYWLNKVQKEYINVFTEESVPVTLGIITDSFGNDPIITDAVKELLKNNLIEVANHGIGNLPLTDFTKQEQEELIQKSIDNIRKILNTDSSVFIPPQNKFNNDTTRVLIDKGITHLSSSLVQGDTPPFPLENQTLYRFPEITSTGIFDAEKKMFVGVNHEDTFSEAMQGLERYGFAVITSHPQEFSIANEGTYTNEVNRQQIDELRQLIQKIKSEEIRIVPISQINIDLTQTHIPYWIKNNAGWWADGSIDDSTFVQGIQYLIKEGIMNIPPTTPNAGTGSNEIPSWIKNNAGWWANNRISDSDFVSGIEYLIKNGIMKY